MISCPGPWRRRAPACPTWSTAGRSASTSASFDSSSIAARMSAGQAVESLPVHDDEKCRGVERDVGVEFHVVVEARQRIAPVGDDAVDLACLHCGHDIVHLKDGGNRANRFQRHRDRPVRRAQPHALQVRRAGDPLRRRVNEARVVHEQCEDLVVAGTHRRARRPCRSFHSAREPLCASCTTNGSSMTELRGKRFALGAAQAECDIDRAVLDLGRLLRHFAEWRGSVVDLDLYLAAGPRFELPGPGLCEIDLKEAGRVRESGLASAYPAPGKVPRKGSLPM